MWRWWPAAPIATATAALNRNRNQSTGRAVISDFMSVSFRVGSCEAEVSGDFMDFLSGGWCQMPAWVATAPVPRLVISAMTAPARATTAATRKALCIPAVNVAWLMRMIWLASWGGVLPVTGPDMGTAPTETALF